MLFDRKRAKHTRMIPKISKHKGKARALKRAGAACALLTMYMSLFLSALAISVVLCAQNSDLYDRLQTRCGLFEGKHREDERAVSDMNRSLTEYLSGEIDHIENTSERAMMHMRDVKRLIDFAGAAGTGLFLLSAALAYLIGRFRIRLFPPLSLVPVFTSIVLIAIFSLSDFSAVFYRFHEIAFDNDLWLLSPDEDLLIRCLPEAFFFQMALCVFACALIGYGLSVCTIILFINKFGRRDS